MVSLTFFVILTFSFFFFFYYTRRDEIPTSENLLLALIFIAITLFFSSMNKTLINQNVTMLKRLCLCSNSSRKINERDVDLNPVFKHIINEAFVHLLLVFEKN